MGVGVTKRKGFSEHKPNKQGNPGKWTIVLRLQDQTDPGHTRRLNEEHFWSISIVGSNDQTCTEWPHCAVQSVSVDIPRHPVCHVLKTEKTKSELFMSHIASHVNYLDNYV